MNKKQRKFEYAAIHSGPRAARDELLNTLGKLGEDGWELVSVLPISNYHGETTDIKYFLKREVL